jgi:hypothetical protein
MRPVWTRHGRSGRGELHSAGVCENIRPMRSRDRFLALYKGEPVDRLPFFLHWEPWSQTLVRWKSEGMKGENDWRDLFGFDPLFQILDVQLGVFPLFERTVLADEGDTIVFRDDQGVIKRDWKKTMSMPQFLDYPVKDWKSWEEHKRLFDPDTPGRFPQDWKRKAKAAADTDGLVGLSLYPYGFCGGARTMMGAEAYLLACALEPELIDDINRTLCRLWMVLWGRVFDEVHVDQVFMWEDMAGKQGSLISPAMFRRFLTPYYAELCAFARSRGVEMISVDSDGYIHELTGLFIEAGVNGIMPYEVQAGNDLAAMLAAHPSLIAFGGMDKRCMAADAKAMDREIERIRPLLASHRLIPYPDHLIPADVSWENFQYFVWRWKDLIGKKT